jgi:hypothetical protein
MSPSKQSNGNNNNVSPEGAGSFIHIDPCKAAAPRWKQCLKLTNYLITSAASTDFADDNPSLIQHVKFTILWKIWPSMLFFTSLAIMLQCLRTYLPKANPTIPPTMLTVLGTVLGMSQVLSQTVAMFLTVSD